MSATKTDAPEVVEEAAWGVLPDGGQDRILEMMAQHQGTDWSKVRRMTLHLWNQSVRQKLDSIVVPVYDTSASPNDKKRMSHSVETDAEAEELALEFWLSGWATDAESQRRGSQWGAQAVSVYRCPVCEVEASKQPGELRCPGCEAVRNYVLAEKQKDVIRPDGKTVEQFVREQLNPQPGTFAY
jgi:hypothetical protein